MRDFSDILLFIPEKELFVSIAEGTGDNLLPEDIEAGYADYINYEVLTAKELWEHDDGYGGMIMYTELVQEKFYELEECIPEVLYDAFEEDNIPFTIIARGGD